MDSTQNILFLDQVGINDIELVGGSDDFEELFIFLWCSILSTFMPSSSTVYAGELMGEFLTNQLCILLITKHLERRVRSCLPDESK